MSDKAIKAFTTPKPLKMSAHAYIEVARGYGHLPPPLTQDVTGQRKIAHFMLTSKKIAVKSRRAKLVNP